ncbi:hypothetical protein ACE38V_12760 [Cytobacillus sp. Hz8]|uniref:hypothetical protein n=1 Tax=Cytobacillus sp. Hz8 TaxID=3347168 RepID=UPI0035DB463E
MQGWIKLHRKIRANPIFNDHKLLRLWLICLTEASHKERDQIVERKTVHLMPGQFITGRFAIFDMYNNGLKPVDRIKEPKTVYRWLEKLEMTGYLTIKKTTKYSVVTINNWSLYQNSDHQDSYKRPSFEPTIDHKQESKEVKNEKEKRYMDLSIHGDDFLNIYLYYFNQKFQRQHMKVSKENHELIQNQLDSFRKIVDIEEFEEIVQYHFEYLPANNDGNVLPFLIAFPRYLEQLQSDGYYD